MTTLAPPVFVENNAAENEAALKSLFEQVLGKILYPAQSESLLMYAIAYLQTITKSQIQYTGEQTLVNYATGANLDQIGEFWGSLGTRLEASKALCTLRFTLASIEVSDRIIPLGTRVRTSDRKFVFATTAIATITAGNLTVDVAAEATVAGKDANGYAAGEVREPFDLLSNLASAENVRATNSGADAETDDAYRTRLKLAPTALSVAGSRDAYRYWALTADPTITAVNVRSPSPSEQVASLDTKATEAAQAILDEVVNIYGGTLGTATAANAKDTLKPYISVRYFYVEVYVLTSTGLPSAEIVQKVQNVLDANTIRPLNDEVIVKSPTNVDYTVSAQITAYNNVDLATLQANLDNAANEIAAELDASMGRDIVRSQLISALQLNGVYNVVLNSPANDIEVNYDQKPNNIAIAITISKTIDQSN
ncbi:MAG: baseplate J/gp47 family protein [Cyanobacteria bacterium SBLK]|nr:baseplate J/gp47 family protein [Cyanobacteria bacterium SBLK]